MTPRRLKRNKFVTSAYFQQIMVITHCQIVKQSSIKHYLFLPLLLKIEFLKFVFQISQLLTTSNIFTLHFNSILIKNTSVIDVKYFCVYLGSVLALK